MTTTLPPTSRTGWRMDDSTFGARLALVRQRMDWNIKEAARECGVPAASWRTWERDGVEPRRLVEIAALIADRTGCDYGWLLAGPRLGATTSRWLQATEPAPRRPPNGPGHGTPSQSTRRPARLRSTITAVAA